MTSERGVIADLNARIMAAETDGDREFFDSILAPAFAMRRASGAIVNREAFIEAVARSATRTTEIQTIAFHGVNRATVSCAVSMDTLEGVRRFQNLRLFVRATTDAPWLLMAWANEVV
jgi:hypothetical protein